MSTGKDYNFNGPVRVLGPYAGRNLKPPTASQPDGPVFFPRGNRLANRLREFPTRFRRSWAEMSPICASSKSPDNRHSLEPAGRQVDGEPLARCKYCDRTGVLETKETE